MNKKWSTLLFLLSSFYSFSQSDSLAQSIEEVVVTATKYSTKKSKVASAVYVIDSITIEQSPNNSLSEFLNQIPGIHVQESLGNAGSPQQYSMRGSRSKDVLILVDGVPISDDSQIQSFQDLNLISMADVERIEVQTGAATTYYGSNAAAGVINIITKGKKVPLARINASYGSWNTKTADLSANLPLSEIIHLKANFSTRHSDGFTAALDSLNTGNFDQDGSKLNQANLSLIVAANENISTTISGSFNQHKFDFDGGAFLDSEDRQENQQNRYSLNSNWQNILGELNLKAAILNNDREQKNPFGRVEDQLFSEFEANQIQGDIFHKFEVLKDSYLLTGLFAKNTQTNQYGVDFFSGQFAQNLSADSAKFTLFEPYAAFQWNENKWVSIDAGGRYHSHSDYNGEFVYHIRPLINLINTETAFAQLKGGYLTSYNTPSLYQLYSIYGNQELSPESSKSYEGTFSLNLFDAIQLSSTYYQRKEENILGFSNSTFRYANLEGESKIKGWENNLNYQKENWRFNLFQASAKRDKIADGYRLPKNEWGANASYSLKNQLSVTTQFRRVGERVMPLFNSTTFQTDEFLISPYNLWNIHATYTLPWNMEINGSIKNILDDEIVDNLGYSWQERNYTMGLSWVLNE